MEFIGGTDIGKFLSEKWYTPEDQLPWETPDQMMNRRLGDLIDALDYVEQW